MDRLGAAALLVIAVLSVSSCSRHDKQLQDHEKAFASLASTTAAIGNAWLDGSVSGTYTSTAIEQTLLLVEQERTAITSAPELLSDQRGGALADSAAKLSRDLAAILNAVHSSDSDTVRRRLESIPFRKTS